MNLIKGFFSLELVFVCTISYQSIAQPRQINIPRIEQMPNQPAPYNVLNWKKVAQQYDSFVYDVNKTGQYLPLVTIGGPGINYPQNKTIIMRTYVGTNSPGGSEAINVLPSLVGASLVGIDKRNQFGQNWLAMSQNFFNKANGEDIYLNNAGAGSGSDWWYDVMPNVFFYQLMSLYPNADMESKNQFGIIADRFLTSVKAMNARDTPWTIPNMNYRAWNFKTMQGNANGVKEPEASGAYAWILYNAYKNTGNKEYLKGAEWAMEYFNTYPDNPSYELQLPYGTSIAAKMNAELGTNYDIQKMVNWSFNKGPLRNWGTIVGTWGGFDVSGLVGEANDGGNDYAFQLNGVQQAGALLPMVRYDKRFARAIGKWILNLANATRLFYPNYLPDRLQDAAAWSNQYDPNRVIGYEALREKLNGSSPFSTGDALKGGWAGTNLSLYSTSSIGYLGSLIEFTNVEKVLKLDLLKTDFFHTSSFPSYLLFNPFNSSQSVQINVGNNPADLYDVLTESFILKNVSGTVDIPVPANQALSIVIAAANPIITYDHNKLLFNGIVVDYRQTKQAYTKPVRIKAVAATSYVIQKGDSTKLYVTAEDPDGGKINYKWNATNGLIDGSGNIVLWHAAQAEGKTTIKVIATDDQNNMDSATLDISVVNKINLAPQISGIEKNAAYTNTNGLIQLNALASDANGDSLTYQWTTTGGTFNNPGAKSVTWTAPGAEGIYTLSVKALDSGNLFAIASTTILVKNFNNTIGKLIAYYPFNSSANDVSGNQLHGEVSGTVFVPDRNGKQESAIYFNGGAQHVTVNNDPLLNVQDAITVSFWFNAARLPDKETFLLSHGSWQNRWKISLTPEKNLRWTVNTLIGIADLDAPKTFVTDSFYFITAAYDGSFMTLYVNGDLIAYKVLTGKIRTTALPFLMGQMLPDNAEYNFKGILDEVKIFDYAITPVAVASLFKQSTTPLKNLSSLNAQLLKISPNPVLNELNITLPYKLTARSRLNIRDVHGKNIVNTFSMDVLNLSSVDVSHLSPGVYIILLQSLSQTYVAKFIKL